MIMNEYKYSMLNTIIFYILIIVCLIKNGSGLKCYVCDTSLNETCSNINSNSNIKSQECDLQKQTNIRTWLAALNNIDLDSTSNRKIDTPMLCQKVVGTKGNGIKTTYRFCQLDSKHSNPCESLKRKISKSDEKIEIISCDVCREDNCNSAIQQKTYLKFIGFLSALSIFISKKIL